MSREALGLVVGDFKVLFFEEPQLGAKFTAKSRIWILEFIVQFQPSALLVVTGNSAVIRQFALLLKGRGSIHSIESPRKKAARVCGLGSLT